MTTGRLRFWQLLSLLLCIALFAPVQASVQQAVPLTAREISDKASEASKAQQVIQWQADGSIRMTAPMQAMQAIISPSGLSLHSVGEGGDAAFGWRLTHLGRETWLPPVSERGSVGRRGDVVALLRQNVIEEYSASADGIRQDFVVPYKPTGEGALTLELAVQGAGLAVLGDDNDQAIVVTMADGRELHYHALHVTDANGAELAARMMVADAGRLRIAVEDRGAVYPLRIDPTFSDADWTSLVDSSDFNNGILAAVVGDGNLYVSGNFTIAPGVIANRIAMWNGSAWSALGSGMNGTVGALAWDVGSRRLYAGGSFTTAGGTSANRIAMWDGSAWSALGSGMNDRVLALAWDTASQRLYAGGAFTTAGGKPARVAMADFSPKADLEIAKDASRATAMVGDDVVFSIVVSNSGPNDVTGASVIDIPPATLVDVEWACVPPPVSSVACPDAPHDAGQGAMNVLVDLPADEYLRYDLSGTLQGVIGAQIQNTASVAAPSGVTDPDEGNNSSTASVLIVPEGIFADGFEAERGALTVPAAEKARVRK